MKKDNKLLFLISFLFFFINVFSQEEIYLKKEQERIKKANQVEVEIENFIFKNYSSYNLSKRKINEITQKIEQNSENNNHDFDEHKRFDLYKKQALRELFFEKYPEKASLFKAIELPDELQQQCFNGGFESGIANYTFRSSSNSVFVGCSTATNTSDFIGFTPGLNNFNANATLVTPGFDPTLALLAVDIPRVLTGTSAIKLGKMLTDQITDVTTMTRALLIDEPYLTFNFSLIIEGEHEGAFTAQSFFKARVLDQNNNLVDEVCFSPTSNNCNYIQVPNNPNNGDDLFYTNWVCESLDVSSIVGQNATVEFTIADCWVGKHSATVYIDDICGTSCANPLLGSIDLDPVNINCPMTPFQVCGTYNLPANSSGLNVLTLNVLLGGNVVGTINTPSQLTSNTFCFLVDPSDPSLFTSNPMGLNFEFRVNGTFNFTCFNPPLPFTISDLSANDGPDVSFEGCCLPTLTSNVNFPPSSNIHEKRVEWIKTTDKITNFSEVIYIAGEYIEMNPGFHTTAYGARFSAYIGHCDEDFVYKTDNNTKDDESNVGVDYEINLTKNKITIYPNPTNSLINVSYSNSKFNQVTIISMEGRVVYNQKIEMTNDYQLDISNFKSGIYTLSIATVDGNVFNEKLIKN